MFKPLAALPFALLFSLSARAAEPAREVHPDLVKERVEADARFREASAAQAGAAETLKKANAAFHGCRNGRLQIRADATLRRAEAARHELEAGRRGVQSLRKDLERRRVELEGERRALLVQYHGKTSSADYDAGEKAYEDGMRERYIKPLDGIVQQVKDYDAGIAAYAQVIEKYAGFCSQPGYTDAAGVAFVKELEASVDAFSTSSQAFAKSVNDARMSPDKAHAAVQ